MSALGGAAPSDATDGKPLSVADLAAYRAALLPKSDEPVSAVGFRALWNEPGKYQGKRVRVEGRVVRRFQQGAFGTFPPLEEVWMVAPSGDPFCVVFPAEAARPAVGVSVQFVGTFLKRVRYEGGDGPRLAPLIVGDRPPIALDRATGATQPPGRGVAFVDWTVGLVVAALVVTVLAARHLRRPVRRPGRFEIEGPPPEFLRPGESP